MPPTRREHARLRLRLLGGFEARLASGAPLTFPTRKAQALLAYLGLRPGQPHSRDKLAALLWGDRGDEQARDSLRHTLVELRKTLPDGPARLVADGRALSLDPAGVEVDVATFEQCVARGTAEALAEARELYRGDFLDGFALREAPFEEWLVTERERLRELALGTLRRLLEQQRAARASEPAIRTALRLLALDATQEVAHRALMRLYVQQGRRAAALRQYQTCVSVLQRELGTDPEVETRQLYQEIVQRREKPARAERTSPKLPAHPAEKPRPGVRPEAISIDTPLIGRDAELQTLRSAFDEAQWGRGRVVAIVGEAGVGKSRLVSELAKQAAEGDARVLVGRCYESEQILPFGPWVDALRAGQVVPDDPILLALDRSWQAELARLFPEIAAADLPPPSDDARRLFESITLLIRSLAMRQPVLLVLEDVHWADEMTSRLLAVLGRLISAHRVLLAVTAREEDLLDADILRRTLGELRGEGHFADLVLSPLSRSDTSSLVRSLSGAGGESRAVARLEEQAWAASEGNPFVVVETVRAWREGMTLQETAKRSLPQRVRDVIVGRLERLSDQGRQLLSVAAVIGREFDFALLQRASGLTDRDAAAGMDELVRRQMLRGAGDGFDFTHDRIREVLQADLLAPRRRVLHKSVAEAIAAVYADDLEPHILALGLHCHAAEQRPEAMSYLRRAAGQALARSAYREAAVCLERALEAAAHLPGTPQTHDQMLDLQLELRTALWPLADFDRIARCLDEAEALATVLADRRRLGRIAAFMSVLRWVTGDFATARRLGQSARDIGAALGDRPLLAMATFYVGLAAHLLADYGAAEAAYLANIRTLTGAEGPDPLGLPGSTLVRSRAWLVLPLAERGRFADGLAHGHAALDHAESARDPYGIVSAAYCLAFLHALKGDVEPAMPLLERAVAVCREREFGVWLPQVTGYLGHVYALVGRVDEGRALLAQAIEIYDATRAWPFRTLLTAHRGLAELRAGRPDAARALGRQARALAREHGERGHEAWALRLLGEIAAHGEPGEAASHYADALALASELGMRPLAAHCHAGLGRLARRAGRGAQGEEHLARATAMYREVDMRPVLE